MKFYRVQTGFGPDDFISIDETELEMCVRAQITGKVAVTKEGTVSGSIIQKITPDWNRVLGYNRLYKLQGEDYRDIGERRIEEYRLALADTTTNVQRQLQGLPPLPKLAGATVEGARQLSEKFNVNTRGD